MKYPVKRGSRYDRLYLNLVHDWVVEGLGIIDGNRGDEDIELIHRNPEAAIGMMAGDELWQYCRIVIYSGTNKAGKRAKLEDVDKNSFEIPPKTASPTELAQGFLKWLKLDEEIALEIDEAIVELNKPPAPRHSLPVEQLTDEELSDPNS